MVAFQSIFYCKRAKWQWIKSIWSEEMPLKGHQDHPMERVCRYRLVTAVAGPPVQLLTAMPDVEPKPILDRSSQVLPVDLYLS